MIVVMQQVINMIIFLNVLNLVQMKHIHMNTYQNVLMFVQIQHILLIKNAKNVIQIAKHVMVHLMKLILIVLHVYPQINI